MRKFKCIQAWSRNGVGDIVEDYMFRRYPPAIRQGHFIEVKETPKKKSSGTGKSGSSKKNTKKDDKNLENSKNLS